MRRLVLAALLTTAVACAPKRIVAPPAPSEPSSTTPAFPEFVKPVVPPSFSGTPAAASFERGWRLLQAADIKAAEREFEGVLKTTDGFDPAEAGLGYVELARDDAKAALSRFDRVLQRDKGDLSSLVGRGRSLLALNRESEALDAFEAALAVAPTLGDLQQRVEVMRLRRQQNDLNRAHAAATAGRLDEARGLYTRAIEASPDSAFLYRELAAVERKQGEDDRALEHLAKAVQLEPGDTASRLQTGEILEARSDFEGALKAFSEALALEPDDHLASRVEAVRARAALARLPAEYRNIDALPQMTRGDLAALVGVRLATLLQPVRGRDAVVITDIGNHWAASWVVAVARAGVMDPFANHTFQPRALVRRTDLAQVVNRLLGKVAAASSGQPHPWVSQRLKFSDLASGHLAYPAASAAVASGAMTVGPNNTFQPLASVTGKEAIAAVQRLEALMPSARGNASR